MAAPARRPGPTDGTQPHEYRAIDEYNKTSMRNRPGNIPAHLMKAAMQDSISKVLDPNRGIDVLSSVEIVQGWAVKDREQKLIEIAGITDLGMIRTLITMDDDEDIQQALIDRKRELKPI